jgi:hypothetical protein
MDAISKISNRKGAGGMAQIVDICLTSMKIWVQTLMLPQQKIVLKLKAQPSLPCSVLIYIVAEVTGPLWVPPSLIVKFLDISICSASILPGKTWRICMSFDQGPRKMSTPCLPWWSSKFLSWPRNHSLSEIIGFFPWENVEFSWHIPGPIFWWKEQVPLWKVCSADSGDHEPGLAVQGSWRTPGLLRTFLESINYSLNCAR